MTKLTYAQLREILALTLTAGPVRIKLDDLLAGREISLNEGQLIDLIVASNIDIDIIRILSGKDPEALEAFEGVGYIADFFTYIKASLPKLAAWLAISRSGRQKPNQKRHSKSSK